jgi:DNA-binding GntR family transcriptional regulator
VLQPSSAYRRLILPDVVADFPTTRSAETYSAVRADLLAARYKPGEWVKVAELQRQLGVSLSVIREALSRLVAEGLLVTIAQRGFRVVELSHQDLLDVTDARVKIETMVLRESLTFGNADWEAALLGAHHVLEHTSMRGAEKAPRLSPRWIPVHAAFHETLLAGCRNRQLLTVANGLRDKAELYRMWSPTTRQSARSVAAEHKKLTELALARDIDACEALLARHIDQTRQALILTEDGSSGQGR